MGHLKAQHLGHVVWTSFLYPCVESTAKRTLTGAPCIKRGKRVETTKRDERGTRNARNARNKRKISARPLGFVCISGYLFNLTLAFLDPVDTTLFRTAIFNYGHFKSPPRYRQHFPSSSLSVPLSAPTSPRPLGDARNFRNRE